MSFWFYAFLQKIGIMGKNLYLIHTLFILYLGQNHPLCTEKLYFILNYSSGNTDQGKLNIFDNYKSSQFINKKLGHPLELDHAYCQDTDIFQRYSRNCWNGPILSSDKQYVVFIKYSCF